ncbi:hypothetical protein SEA_AMORE2_85 [Gordonia phage Amore2]|nr:hypothetical protein SEA_AMORE2_85 [Gordonia phage Amore2]
MKIISAEVMDPALSGDYDTPARLEVMVDAVPDEPSFVETNVGQFSIIHHHWLQSIFSDLPEWDDEDTQACASIFNSAMATEDREPVVPVTVVYITGDNFPVWKDYYVKVTRVRRILNRLERESIGAGYEIVPDPTYALEKKQAWMISHPERVCVVCVEDDMQIHGVLASQVKRGCKMQQVRSHRVVPMCKHHRIEWNRAHEDRRKKELN